MSAQQRSTPCCGESGCQKKSSTDCISNPSSYACFRQNLVSQLHTGELGGRYLDSIFFTVPPRTLYSQYHFPIFVLRFFLCLQKNVPISLVSALTLVVYGHSTFRRLVCRLLPHIPPDLSTAERYITEPETAMLLSGSICRR